MAVQWVQVTEKHYYDMLGVLPPAAYGDYDSFQVGEPMDHKAGSPTFASFKIVNGIHYESSEALTFNEFRREVGRASYHYSG